MVNSVYKYSLPIRCIYVCMYVSMCVCMHVCMYICMCVNICMHVYMYECMNVCMHVCMHTCICMYIYVCVCMYAFVCLCAYLRLICRTACLMLNQRCACQDREDVSERAPPIYVFFNGVHKNLWTKHTEKFIGLII